MSTVSDPGARPGHRGRRHDGSGSAVSSRGRTRVAAGVCLLAVGLVLLGWVGWQLWGTTWVGHRVQREVVSQVERAWEAGGPGPDGSGAVRTDRGLVGAVVRIPRFGRDYAVPVYEGTDDDVLAAGFGHFEGSAAPGEVGNLALAGHRITHGEPLRRMLELRVGDRVVVETRGTVFTYELVTPGDALRVPFTDTWVVDPEPVNPDPDGTTPPPGPQRLLTLTTCSELFHTDDRSVAFATLVSEAPRAG